MSVLKLAKMWDLSDVRDRALSQSTSMISNMSPLEKILIGRKHGVVKWLKDGYKAIGCRKSGLTQEEKDSLDLATRCGLLELRDRVWTWAVANYTWSSDAAACKAMCDCESAMLDIFGDELRDGSEVEHEEAKEHHAAGRSDYVMENMGILRGNVRDYLPRPP